MNKYLLSISIAAVCFFFLFSSCSKTITCWDGVIAIYPVGFTKTDFDSALVFRYKQDNAFDSIADSTHIAYYSNGDHDTGSLVIMSQYVSNGTHPAFLTPGYDYKIFLPAAGKTYAITNILQRGNKTQSYSGSGKDVSCTNSIISCNLNGIPVIAPANSQSMPVNIVK